LIAEIDGDLIGHILFTPAQIEVDKQATAGMGLAPMAIHPQYQKNGIGSALVEAGLHLLREQRCPFVIVLGHPDYYPRFGFGVASRHGIQCQWEVPDEAFMVRILDPRAMESVTGVARY